MHLLQSPHWRTFKSKFNWNGEAIPLPNAQAPVQILFRQLPLGLNFAYVPKGPDIDWENEAAVDAALAALKAEAYRSGTLFLKIEPDVEAGSCVEAGFHRAGFVQGKSVQPEATICIDIASSEDEILAAMKSKTRYNIRLARKKGVSVRQGSAADLAIFHQLSLITGNRDGFGIHPLAYYQAVFSQFPLENRALLLAEYQDEPLAGLMVFAWEGRAYYLYGASSNKHRNKMPAYLLQWEAIRWAKATGCHTYDLWGIPNAAPEMLEAEFANRNDGLWGVYRFKRGFGGQVVHSAGAFDFVYNKPLYFAFSKLLERRSG